MIQAWLKIFNQSAGNYSFSRQIIRVPEFDEHSLVGELKTGSEKAFRLLVERYSDRVYNTALGMLQNEADAEDLSQEVFIEVFRSVKNFRGESSIKTWLYRITVTRCLDHLRSKKRKKRIGSIVRFFFNTENDLQYDQSHFVHPGVLLENKERAAILFSAIESLPEQQRTAFTLSKIEELSQKEIAEVMNCSEGSVESLLVRAKKNLRKILSENKEI